VVGADGTLVTVEDFMKDVELIKQGQQPIYTGIGQSQTAL
jgi:hypothetical protein